MIAVEYEAYLYELAKHSTSILDNVYEMVRYSFLRIKTSSLQVYVESG